MRNGIDDREAKVLTLLAATKAETPGWTTAARVSEKLGNPAWFYDVLSGLKLVGLVAGRDGAIGYGVEITTTGISALVGWVCPPPPQLRWIAEVYRQGVTFTASGETMATAVASLTAMVHAQ